MGLFFNCFQEYGIVAKYTVRGSPEQNGVAKGRIATLRI